jgi:hypothetical protein
MGADRCDPSGYTGRKFETADYNSPVGAPTTQPVGMLFSVASPAFLSVLRVSSVSSVVKKIKIAKLKRRVFQQLKVKNLMPVNESSS